MCMNEYQTYKCSFEPVSVSLSENGNIAARCLANALGPNNHPPDHFVVTWHTRDSPTCSERSLFLLALPRKFVPLWILYPRSPRALEGDVIMTKIKRRTETGTIVGLNTVIGTETETETGTRKGTEKETGIGTETETETETTTIAPTADVPHPPHNPLQNALAGPARVTRAMTLCATATPSQATSKPKCQKLETTLYRLR